MTVKRIPGKILERRERNRNLGFESSGRTLDEVFTGLRQWIKDTDRLLKRVST